MLERIGNCRIVEEVAAGGMAVVYRAIQDPLGRTVAIKALKTSLAAEESIVTRFEREAASLASLSHENLINVYDFHREQGALYIVMEYVAGLDLFELLDRCGRLPVDVAAAIALQVARALDYVHYRGIIHRDIKPANIMLARSGGVKVMDFGIARDVDVGGLTELGTGIGTPAYMSPEQILGDRLDARSDLFSLGIVLYQMLTGRKPFVEDEQHSVMHKIRLLRHQSCRALNAEIPRELARIVDRCLEKQPRDRWRSAQDLVFALERFLAPQLDINHHARLVLFMRSQNLITQLEADEYVRPTVAGAGGISAAPNRQAREAARRGAVAHGIMGGVLLLMLGLIHVAPIGAAAPAALPIEATPVSTGQLAVVVHPWGTIWIDGAERGTSPRAEPFVVALGRHELKIDHPYYEPYREVVDVGVAATASAQRVVIDLEQVGTLRAGRTPPDAPAFEHEAQPPPEPDDTADVTATPAVDAPRPTVRPPRARRPATRPPPRRPTTTRPRPRPR